MTTENTPKKGGGKSRYFAAIIIIVAVAAVGAIAYSQLSLSTPSTSPTPSPTDSNVEITIYGGETGNGFGFGTTPNSLQSPGPTLTFKVGDTVRLTFVNESPSIPHNVAITNAQSSTATVMFNAAVGSGSNPIQAGGTNSVIFTVTQAGNYFYICQVFGHVQSGMWGNVVVNP